ncbi:MAG TPA: class D sortase [Candidatus Limnocylindrales bacterium]|nr:class D sortase [Candidatus Limnocylindrales bacterium]
MSSHKQKANSVSSKPVHPKAAFSFRKNLVPPLLGLAVFGSVLALLNAQWIIAQYQYRFQKPTTAQVAVIDTSSPDPQALKLQIPSVNISAPIVFDEKSFEESKVQLALRRGVVHYGTTAVPGQADNTVIVGHSSGQLWAPGDYKFVFTHLDKVKQNDRIFVDYQGTRYIYRVSEILVVDPTNVSVVQPTTKPLLTLITCTPVGTSKQRLVIRANQVSPQPETATPVAAGQVKPFTARSLSGDH